MQVEQIKRRPTREKLAQEDKQHDAELRAERPP